MYSTNKCPVLMWWVKYAFKELYFKPNGACFVHYLKIINSDLKIKLQLKHLEANRLRSSKITLKSSSSWGIDMGREKMRCFFPTPIETLHVMYHPANMADCSNPFKRTEGMLPQCALHNKCTVIKSVDNNSMLNRLHTAMITVLDMGSNLLFGVNRWKRAGPLYNK